MSEAKPRASLKLPIFVVALFLVDRVGAHALDALGVVESLLSPSGARVLVILPLCVLFFAARLLLVFVAPGLVLASLARRLLEIRRRQMKKRSDEGAGPP